MTFIETVSESQATGAVADMYQRDREAYGELPNFTRAFSPRPGVYAAWRQLNEAIKANMEPRRYELATLAAARRIGSSYCTLAHGSILIDKFLEPDKLRAVVDDYRTADLDPADLAGQRPSLDTRAVTAAKAAGDAGAIEQAAQALRRNEVLRFNNLLDAAVAAGFLVLVSAIVLLSVREWILLLRQLSRPCYARRRPCGCRITQWWKPSDPFTWPGLPLWRLPSPKSCQGRRKWSAPAMLLRFPNAVKEDDAFWRHGKERTPAMWARRLMLRLRKSGSRA